MIPGYSNIEEIGKGGMGCVYKAIDDKTGRTVAIKMMSNKVTCYPEYRTLFSSEAKTLSDLNHPSIVKMSGVAFSDDQGNLYLPMEYVEGETLLKHVQANGPYSEEEGKELMCQILEAMQYVYSHKKIHRDIKPSNIMLRPDGSICIIDFGIAKDAQIQTGMTVGNVIGTSGYMSPEQAKGLNIDHRTDIYSLGCLFFFILTGHDAIAKAKNDYETKLRVLDTEIPDVRRFNPTISENTAMAIQKATDKNMMKRYQTPADFKRALEGNESSRTNDYTQIEISVGRANDNDIIMGSSTDKVVSQHHGKFIILKTQPDAAPIIIYEDFSTNGTGVNGKYVHKAQEHIPLTHFDMMPEILLAGRDEYKINWLEVESHYRMQTGQALFVQEPVENGPTKLNPLTPPRNPISGILVIIIVLLIVLITVLLVV